MARKDELIKELSEKYKKPEEEIREAVNSQFKFVRNKIASGEFPEIRLPYFGLFRAKKSRIKHLNKHKNNDNKES